MLRQILLLVGVAVLFVNCASISTLQTGRVLPKGESQHSLGLSTYQSDDFIGGDSISLPVIEYSYRRGVWDKVDLGLKLAIIGSLSGDLKYSLVDGEKWAIATGLGLGYLPFESSLGGVKSEVTIIDVTVPLFVSYDLTEMATLYSAAKYVLRNISTNTAIAAADGSMASGTLGLQYGRKSGVFIEGSMITGLDNSFTGTQFNASYFFGF